MKLQSFVIVIAGAVAMTIAASASATESTIYPGVGIGKVKLGMTKAQVERALGTAAQVDERAQVGGHAYLQLGWDFDSLSVGFLLERGRYRAVNVSTFQTQRTASGVGPGTPWLKLVRAYPHGLCSWGPKYYLVFLVPHEGGTQTLFTFRGKPPNVAYPETYVVTEAVVRTRNKPLPQTAPRYELPCAEGWQTTKLPRPRPW